MTSGAKSDGRFGKQDFVYLPTEDVYRCPAGEKLTYRYTNEEDGKTLRRYWTTACPGCPFKSQCTTAPQRRPGGNVTGVATLNLEVGPKRLELMHELIPSARILALLVNP